MIDGLFSKRRIVFFLWLLSLLLRVEAIVLRSGVITWQLHNQCSQGFLELNSRHLDANGDMDSRCLTDFIVYTDLSGQIRLQHALSKAYVCFNRRRQLITKPNGRKHKRCHFYERISEAGYTELESAAERGLYLGFNKKGFLQDPFTYWTSRKCFSFMKFERFVSREDLKDCGRKRKKNRSIPQTKVEPSLNLQHIFKDQLMSQIRARPDDIPF